MSIHDGRLADGITMRPREDQNQIVSSMERLTLVDDLSHGLGNTADENQRLDQSGLVRVNDEDEKIYLSTYMGLLELNIQEQCIRLQFKKQSTSGGLVKNKDTN